MTTVNHEKGKRKKVYQPNYTKLEYIEYILKKFVINSYHQLQKPWNDNSSISLLTNAKSSILISIGGNKINTINS